MAELLDGTMETSHSAPLSGAQTVAIGHYLLEQIQELQDVARHLHSGLEVTNSSVRELRGVVKDTVQEGMSELKAQLTAVNNNLKSTQRELDRTNAKVAKLDTENDEIAKKALNLKEELTASNAHLRKVTDDHANTHQLCMKLQDRVEHRIEEDLQTLRDDLSKTNLDMKNLGEDVNYNKSILNDVREAQRDTHTQVKTVLNDFAKAGTKISILDQRATDMATAIKDCQSKMDDQRKFSHKINEQLCDTSHTTNDVNDLVKQVVAHLKQVDESGQAVGQKLKETQGVVRDHTTSVDALNRGLTQAHAKAQSLKEAQELQGVYISQLREGLTDVHHTTQAVKAGLKESNALLLPNIFMDSPSRSAPVSGELPNGTNRKQNVTRSGASTARNPPTGGPSATNLQWT